MIRSFCLNRSRLAGIRKYHSTQFYLAPKKKDKEPKNEETEVQIPNIQDFDTQMENKIKRLIEEFSKLKGGKLSADMYNHVTIDAYGRRSTVGEAGQPSLKGGQKLSISVFDPALVNIVANAIRDSGMGVNPTVEGNSISINVPKPSKEARENIIKLAQKIAEKSKQDVRQVRKDGMDSMKKIKSSVSEDDSRKFGKEIDALTEKKVDKISKLLKDKEGEILQS